MRAPRKAFLFTSFCEYNFIDTLPTLLDTRPSAKKPGA
jgi:hypothetical protein